jgi:hypothetical protein
VLAILDRERNANPSRFDAERARAETAEGRITAALVLHARRTVVWSGSSDPEHVPLTQEICLRCSDPWPCRDVRALTETPTTPRTNA